MYSVLYKKDKRLDCEAAMECPKCGAHNPESAEYCNLCLSRFEQDVPDEPGDLSQEPDLSPSLESTDSNK
ncbi:MAG: hypothetical protein ACYC1U_06180 [Candidatus Aquicultorales bacterium]